MSASSVVKVSPDSEGNFEFAGLGAPSCFENWPLDGDNCGCIETGVDMDVTGSNAGGGGAVGDCSLGCADPGGEFVWPGSGTIDKSEGLRFRGITVSAPISSKGRIGWSAWVERMGE